MNRDAVRSKVKAAVRRGMGKVDSLDRIVARRDLRLNRTARLVEFYDRLRPLFSSVPPTPAGSLPAPEHVDEVEGAAVDSRAAQRFLADVVDGGDIDAALVGVVRTLLDANDIGRARSVAQVLQRSEHTRPVGDICQALVTLREPLAETAWQLFSRNDVAVAMRLAPVDYFHVAFRLDPQTARTTLARAVDGEFRVDLMPGVWLDLARSSFTVGAEDVAAGAADRAEAALGNVEQQRAEQLAAGIAALRSWFGRRAGADAGVAVPEGEIPFAVLDCQLPGRPLASPNEGDAFNTAAALGNLARRRGVRFTGDEGVVALAENLRSRVDPRRAIDGEDATVRLYRVDRDASDCSAVPDGTWLLASGPFVHTPNDLHRNLPLNRRVRPIFIGFHTEPRVLHDGGVIAYLQRHAPIGCRDWRTVYLLQAAGIPAFFSGWITTTLDTVSGAGGGTVPGAFGRDHLAALDRTLALANGPQPVRTKEMRVYLAGRALGAQVDFRPEHAGDVALDGLIGISDPEFERLRSTVLDLLSTVLAAVVAGKGEDEVYAAWREACTPFVAEAQARSAQPLPELPPPSFDVAAAVRQTLAARVVVERSQPAPDGAEINVELSLDGNYKHQLDVVLDSIVVNASRPIRAFVLARDHTRNDFDRMARLFPTVSFVWLPTDDADYGPISGMLRHITVATMDRLLLPDLLPDIDKIIHHDLDALCLADLAELFDIELGNSPIAARDQRHPFQGSGYVSMVNGVAMLDTIERSRELMLRLTRRHPFDYRTFNAGIMVLNLTQMRADGFTRNYLPLIERFGFHDQGLLNLYAGSQHHEFERGWNVYPRFELCEDAKILHWLGPWKPWRGAFIDGQPLWREAEARVVERERAAGLR